MEQKRIDTLLSYVLILLIVILAGAIGGFIGYNEAVQGDNGQMQIVNLTSNDEAIFVGIFEDVKRSMVHIESSKINISGVLHPFPINGTGSGFVIQFNDSKYIITNEHVIAGADKLRVTFFDGTVEEAKLIGSDPMTDVALLETDLPDYIKPLVIGDSDNILPGQIAIAIGNPYALDNTITLGIISGRDRTITTEGGYTLHGIIQTDAAINPGNSGGPLLNSAGEVIGINSAIIPYADGIGFAIPINTAKGVSIGIITHGKVLRPWLGVTGIDLTPTMANMSGIDFDGGVLIVDVFEGDPADSAGLHGSSSHIGAEDFELGDIIIELGGKKIRTMDELINVILEHEIGEEVELVYLRDGKEEKTTVTLTERPADR
ncbi:MAG: serine endoprotease [Candidatus Syntrophoarchaeum sp. GoM_oil]|nr:MAG: serine endoprotease [Candidatus Syntrophoarchaeum sp. GoM_oil]